MISYISKEHKIQFSHIPKSGCQSIRHFIIKINNDNPEMNIWFSDFKSKYVIGGTNTLPGYSHYSFVRNPYARLVSCYYNKIVGQHWTHFINYFGKTGIHRPSFEQFVDFISTNNLKINEHWTRQVDLINNLNTKIFKIEEKEKINDEMLLKTGHSFIYAKPIDHMNIRKDVGSFVGNTPGEELNKMFSEGMQPLVHNFYNEKILKIVYKLYKNDFESFNYSEKIDTLK